MITWLLLILRWLRPSGKLSCRRMWRFSYYGFSSKGNLIQGRLNCFLSLNWCVICRMNGKTSSIYMPSSIWADILMLFGLSWCFPNINRVDEALLQLLFGTPLKNKARILWLNTFMASRNQSVFKEKACRAASMSYGSPLDSLPPSGVLSRFVIMILFIFCRLGVYFATLWICLGFRVLISPFVRFFQS